MPGKGNKQTDLQSDRDSETWFPLDLYCALQVSTKLFSATFVSSEWVPCGQGLELLCTSMETLTSSKGERAGKSSMVMLICSEQVICF